MHILWLTCTVTFANPFAILEEIRKPVPHFLKLNRWSDALPTYVIEGSTIDDILMDAVGHVLAEGVRVKPSRGYARELCGVVIELTNPLARLSRTESRGKIFSCLGELCWYLAGSDSGSVITYYIPKYKEELEDGFAWGAYGPRLFGQGARAQFQNVSQLLKRKPESRRAVMQLFEGNDLVEHHLEIPCTCTMQFMRRDGKLDMLTYMRSNDAHLGLPHDIFSFTFFQEMMARSLGIEVGTYKHMVGSLHIYEEAIGDAQAFVREGYQSTKFPMPPMPQGDPWKGIEKLLINEASLRESGTVMVSSFAELDAYWQDLVRLLEIFRYTKRSFLDVERVSRIRSEMSSNVFDLLISAKLAQV